MRNKKRLIQNTVIGGLICVCGVIGVAGYVSEQDRIAANLKAINAADARSKQFTKEPDVKLPIKYLEGHKGQSKFVVRTT